MLISTFYNKYFKPGIVTTDSRNINAGDIFIALKGDKFNGNLFAQQAIASGACIAVVDEYPELDKDKYLKVNNTLKFLHDLATHHVQQCNTNIIALTGSNGKTTTKELIYSVLKSFFKVQATKGNLNNHIGVPLTILSITPNTEHAIVEMGANHRGEIAQLCDIAQPHCGLITNIGKAHLEGFGSYDGVIQAKSELYRYLISNRGKIYINQQDYILTKLIKGYKNTVQYNDIYGICSAEVLSAYPLKVELSDKNKSVMISSNLFGRYNMTNILAAASVGLDFGLDIDQVKKGIEAYNPTNNRSEIIRLGNTNLILDCYNANPSSMSLALNELKEHAHTKTFLIVGEMKELGSYSHQEHANIVHLANKLGFTKTVFLGKGYKDITTNNGKVFMNNTEIIDYLENEDLSHYTILIKGSRSNEMEKIGNYIVDRLK